MGKITPVIVTFIALMSWACHERITVYPPPRTPDASSSQTGTDVPIRPKTPIPTYTLDPVPAPSIDDMPELGNLNKGDKDFRDGNYSQAIKEYRAYLENKPEAIVKERVLFNIGLSYALSSNPDRNLTGAGSTLKQMAKEFPDSQYKSQVKLILGLIAQIEQLDQDAKTQKAQIDQLQEDLKRLKEIDLKRTPSRPAEQ